MTELVTELVRIAAFSDGSRGGNPAGVWIRAQLPTAEEMQRIAADVGFSETAFAAPLHGEGQEGKQEGGHKGFHVGSFRVLSQVTSMGGCHKTTTPV